MITLLKNASVFAPERRGRADVLVADGRIAAMEATLPDLPADIPHESIDLAGQLLIPGLVDDHVHVTGGGGEAGPSTRVPPIELTKLTLAGVTSCVGVLGTDGTTRTVRDLVACTLSLREQGLSVWCYTGSYQIPPPTLMGSVRDDIVFVDPI
ncbi:MAG: beta-aspartyl-peptidase, partial [Myxococcota bacterium]